MIRGKLVVKCSSCHPDHQHCDFYKQKIEDESQCEYYYYSFGGWCENKDVLIALKEWEGRE